MEKKTLTFLLEGICSVPHSLERDITGLSLDSRTLKPGDLFFACAGTNQDGKEFIQDAIRKGAIAVLTEGSTTTCVMQNSIPIFSVQNLSQHMSTIAARFYDFPAHTLQLIGVTGTNGKTSCTYFIATALQRIQKMCGIIGTLEFGFVDKIIPGHLTTPDAITLQAMLADLKAGGAQTVAMEVSSHSVEQGRIRDLLFEIGIFTNLTRDHLDYHGSMSAYGEAKRKFLDSHLMQCAVINADDPFGYSLIEALSAYKKVYAYSLNTPTATSVPFVYAKDIQLDLSGIRANIVTPWGEGKLYTPLIGQFNLSNLLAVITTLCLLNIPLDKVLESLAYLNSVPGRMQTLGGGHKPLVVVDYAHTPDALEKVLIALRAHCIGKLHCLFGCGGDRDRGKRPLMAAIAERYADTVMVTNDNPRTENPEQIIADIKQGFTHGEKIIVQLDRAKAIQDVIHYAARGDCVLVAGKGAEMYQQIGIEKIPFSDIEQVREAL